MGSSNKCKGKTGKHTVLTLRDGFVTIQAYCDPSRVTQSSRGLEDQAAAASLPAAGKDHIKGKSKNGQSNEGSTSVPARLPLAEDLADDTVNVENVFAPFAPGDVPRGQRLGRVERSSRDNTFKDIDLAAAPRGLKCASASASSAPSSS